MLLRLLATVVLSGFALLLSILHLMRALYVCGICEPPSFGGDPADTTSTVAHAAARPEST